MNLRPILTTFIFAALLIQPASVLSFETDQYNLPTEPLADIGGEVTEYAERHIRRAVEEVNAEIVRLQICAERDKGDSNCGSPEKLRKRLAYLRSEDAVAKEVFKRLGDGVFPFTKVSLWIEWHKFKGRPARYKTSFEESIHFTAPFSYLTISPTVNMYGSQFGTDKIAHIFQQGYDYYRIHKRAVKKGASSQDAVMKAVKWGQKTERTYFGYWVSGVYSNADLAANFAGLKFYHGLTNEVKIGNIVRPAILVLKDGLWKFNDTTDIKQNLLKPLISDHLNEAYNPSKIFNVLGFHDRVRQVVKKQSCPQWFDRYPGLSRAQLEATTKKLELWQGEDYGFTASKRFITIANTCFSNDQTAVEDSGKF